MPDRSNIKIPKKLYNQVSQLIDETGFNSVTEFVKFVMRDIVTQGEFDGHGEFDGDTEKVRERLKRLGYLDR